MGSIRASGYPDECALHCQATPHLGLRDSEVRTLMGWIHETDTHVHEAVLTPEFENGEKSFGSTMIDDQPHEIVEMRDSGDNLVRPSAEIVGWVLECDCARRGSDQRDWWEDPERWVRVPSASLQDLDRHRIFAVDDDASFVSEVPGVDAAARRVWVRDHLEPADVRASIRAAVAARKAADAQLDDAVLRARQTGLSWAAIAAEAEMKPQSAHERWKDRT